MRVQPFVAALNAGYIVAESAGIHHIVDPREHADDAAAFQSAIDYLAANKSVLWGIVHFGNRRPDGSAWTVPSTVTFCKGGDPILPRGHYFTSGSEGLNCTITDGSPMFKIGDGNQWAGQMIPFGGFSARAAGRDCEAIRIQDGNHWFLSDFHLRDFAAGSQSEAAIVIDGTSYTWGMDRFTWLRGQVPADVLKLTTPYSNRAPSFGYLGPGWQVNDQCRSAITSSCTHGPIIFNGYIEQAGDETEGTAAIYFPDGSGSITITRQARFAANRNEQVFFNGNGLVFEPGFVTNMLAGAENILHLGDNTISFQVSPWNRTGAIAGDEIVIDGPPANPSTIPHDAQLNGSIAGRDMRRVYRPNGYELQTVQTDRTIAAGGEITHSLGAPTFMGEVRLIQTGPNTATVAVEDRLDTTNGVAEKVIKETGGTNQATVSYEIWRREF